MIILSVIGHVIQNHKDIDHMIKLLENEMNRLTR